LAKSSYGSSPLWLYHKIDPPKKKKKTLELQEPKRAETIVGEGDRLKTERFVAAKLIVEFAATLRILSQEPWLVTMATSYGIGVVAGVVATTQGEAVCGGSISNYIARYVINFVCFLEI
jgi:hypothetical protein